MFHETKRWGGYRNNSGRTKRKRGVAHTVREFRSKHDPLLVTLKLGRCLPFLRYRGAEVLIGNRIRAAQRPTFRIVHFSIQADHLHLIVEADSSEDLANGMKGLGGSIAKNLNKLWHRRGKVFPERYHCVVLESLRQVRNALKYVLNNHLKHAAEALSFKAVGARTSTIVRMASWLAHAGPDPFSSGRYFDGWKGRAPEVSAGSDDAPVVMGGWKLQVGWKRQYGAIGVDEVPGMSMR